MKQFYQSSPKKTIYMKSGKTIIIITDVSQTQIDQIIHILNQQPDGLPQ